MSDIIFVDGFRCSGYRCPCDGLPCDRFVDDLGVGACDVLFEGRCVAVCSRYKVSGVVKRRS